LFVSVSAVLWLIGSGVPYANDGSESYTTYLEGYNAATFQGINPLIADVAASPHAADHPDYAPSATSLFARVISQLFIRIGMNDMRAHDAFAIAVAALGLFVALRVLDRMGGTALAVTTVVLFALHYIGIQSWVNSLPVALDFLLFWGNLLLLQRYLERTTPARLTLAAVGIAAAFLHNQTFGAFVLLTELFAVWQVGGPRITRAAFTVATGLAAIVALAAWETMLALTLGPTAVSTAWPPTLGDLQVFQSAFRNMVGLGQGALALLIYSFLMLEIVRLAWQQFARSFPVPNIDRLGSGDLSLLLVVSFSIAACLWIDRSTSLISDWELRPGIPIVHIGLLAVLGALLVLIGVRLSQSKRSAGRDNQEPPEVSASATPHTDSVAAPAAITPRVYIVAVGCAAIVMALFSVGDFVPRYLSTYRPSLVFVEDVILAIVLLALLRRIRWRGPWSLEAVAALTALVVLGSYWLAFQGKLALRYPPTETGLAALLRNNASLEAASFIAEPDTYPVVWYYTRGRVEPAQSPGTSARPVEAQFFVCTNGCDVWRPVLSTAAVYATGPGNSTAPPPYVMYALPNCQSSVAQFACAPLSSTNIPPVLDASGPSGSPPVALILSQSDAGEHAHVTYKYSQAAGLPEVGSVVRLYVMRSDASWCLLDDVAGQTDLQLPRLSSGQFRAGVIPRSAQANGSEYFSDPVEFRPKAIVTLPDTRNGGAQEILAESLEDAEQIALANGTWVPSAGTLGTDSVTRFNLYPSADTLCRQ
jgi:hypothetical protein